MSYLSEQISQNVSQLPEAYQQQVLDFVEFLRTKYRSQDAVDASVNSVSFFDVAQDAIGASEGPKDLSTNPEYLQGYGQ